MNCLTDTHALIWAAENPVMLGPVARKELVDSSNTVYLSVANTWEIAIKRAVGKPSMVDDLVRFACGAGFLVLPVVLGHTIRVETLPLRHHDPFDRLLVAQSIIENLTLITHDAKLPPDGIPILW